VFLLLKIKKVMKKIILSIIFLSITLSSCKQNDKQEEKAVEEEVEVVEGKKASITISKHESSPKFEEATIKLDRASVGSVENDTALVDFEFKVENYNLGEQTPTATENMLANSGKGQHIHFILNNQPYHAYYESSFSKEIPAGNHVLLAFLSRSYHESVKNAFLVTPLKVGDVVEGESPDLSAPHMFYSRPKGTYTGKDTENLLLDFFLVNTEISETGNKVIATIQDQEFTLTEWAPYVIKGLEKGEVKIRLQLVDADGNLIPGPFNDVTRTVTLK
jgi:hypothetical protein